MYEAAENAAENAKDQRCQEHIKDVLFLAGSRWDKPATPEEILKALDAAGFEIVRKTTDKLRQEIHRRTTRHMP
jgi:hypothetical protein